MEVTYSGADLGQELIGTMQHFGVHLRPCCLHVYVIVFWTRDGVALWGTSTATVHIYKIRVPGSWLVQVTNPTATSVVLDNPRFFRPLPANLPRLQDLVSGIDPSAFGGSWVPWAGPLVSSLDPRASFTFRIPNSGDDPTPIVFQVGVKTSSSGTLQAVATDRATEEFDADMDGDGVVGTLDVIPFRNGMGKVSVDLAP